MKTIKLAVVLIISTLLWSFTGIAQQRPYATEMDAFRRQDSISKPQEGIYLFIGSSSIRMWDNLAESFPGKPVLNRGFGGSTLAEVSQNLDVVVYPYKPREIIIYAGENDIAQGVNAQETYNRFVKLFNQLRERYPKIPIVFISIKPSPSREQFLPVVKEANQLIHAFITRHSNTFFVDVFSLMLNEEGSFKDIYLEDKLHMTKQGYEIWTKALRPVLF